MRLLFRLALVGILAIIALIVIAVYQTSQASTSREQREADEAIRLLLAGGDDAQASAGLVQRSPMLHNQPELSFNVAVVLMVSLLSVALLITGIIVVAISMDSSNSENRHPSRLLQAGLVPPISGLQTAIDFDFDETEDVDASTDLDSDRHWNSFWNSNAAEGDADSDKELLPD